jgi:hypothetical protein
VEARGGYIPRSSVETFHGTSLTTPRPGEVRVGYPGKEVKGRFPAPKKKVSANQNSNSST